MRAAHYEPGKVVINMTKLTGAGSLAHEWAHALDHYFGELDTQAPYTSGARGASGWYDHPRLADNRLSNLRPEMAAAFNKVMTAIYKRDKTKAEAVRDAELRVEKAQDNIERVERMKAEMRDSQAFKNGESWTERQLRQWDKWIEQSGRPQVEAAKRRLARLQEGEVKPEAVESSFYRNAQKLSGKSGSRGYWARPTEMFARTFEAYVFDRIGSKEEISQYLVQGVEPDRFASEIYKGNPYPTGDERTTINAAFDELFETMGVREDDALYSLADPSPTFFSGLARGVEGLKQPKAPAGQWKAMIGKIPGVKREEIEWSGVMEWLDEQKGSIARENLVAFLEENQVRVEEVEKNAQGSRSDLQVDYDSEEDVWYILDQEDSIVDGAFATAGEAHDALQELTAEHGDTKFQSYTLPGGENYRELLLTLPRPTRDQVGPTDSAAAPFMDEWNRLSREINELRAQAPMADANATAELLERERDALHARMVDATIAENPRLRGVTPFTGGHFQEPNVLAHVRFNERTDAEGKRVLFLEEIQSDWHQIGRRDGYVGDTSGQIAELETKVRDANTRLGDKGVEPANATTLVGIDTGDVVDPQSDPEIARAWTDYRDALRGLNALRSKKQGVPDAPFKTSWHELAFKRMLRWAAENGFDRLAWTTGEQQVDRYDLSKQVDTVDVIDHVEGGRFVDVRKGGESILDMRYDDNGIITESRSEFEGKPLSDVLGKELADKVLEVPPTNRDPAFRAQPSAARDTWDIFNDETGAYLGLVTGAGDASHAIEKAKEELIVPTSLVRRFEGLDLRVGGEGMRGFYDKILPRFANKYAKKWGARVGETTIPSGPDGVDMRATGDQVIREGGTYSIRRVDGSQYGLWETREEAERFLYPGEKMVDVHALDITEAMRESVLAGQPLFAFQDGRRDRYFKRSREELEAIGDVAVTDVEAEYAGRPYREARDAAFNDAMQNVRGRYRNQHTDEEIVVGRTALREIVSHRPGPLGLELLKAIPDLVRNAVHTEAIRDRTGAENPRIHRFYAPARFDGDIYRVSMIVKEWPSQSIFFYQRPMEIESLDVDLRVVREDEPSAIARSPSRPSLNIGDLLRGVKHDDGTLILSDEPDVQRLEDPRVRIEAVEEKIADDVLALIGRIAPQLKRLEIVDRGIRARGIRPLVAGEYSLMRDLIQVSLAADDPAKAARHEVIHHLRNIGVFTKKEWTALERMARKAWMDQYDIEGRYGADYRERFGDQAEGRLLEEAIAEAFMDWDADRLRPMNPIRRLFERIKSFLDGMRQLLAGEGITRWEQVFGRVERGEVGQRPSVRANLEEAFATRDPAQIHQALEAARGSGVTLSRRRIARALRAAGLTRLDKLYRQVPQELVQDLRPFTDETMFALARTPGPTLTPSPRRARVEGTAEQEAAIKAVMAVEEPKSLREHAQALVERVKETDITAIKQSVVDQFASIEAYEKAVRGGIGDAAMSAYKMARLTQNLQSTMSAVLRHGPLEYRDGGFRVVDGFEGGFEGIFSPLAENGTLHLWKGWAAAKRAQRLISEGREQNFSQDQIDTLLPLSQEFPEFETVLERWQEFNRTMLDMAEASGLINAEQREIWEKDDYVPFYRVMEEGVTGPHGRRGIAGQRSGVKTLTGSEERIGDVIENMVLNITHLVDASFKNVAAQRVIEMMEEGGLADGDAVSPESMDWRVAHVKPAEAAKKLEELGVDVDTLAPDQKDAWLKLFTMVPPKDPDVISVMQEGKPKYYRVHDPLLLSSLVTMRPEGADFLMDALRVPKRWLTVGVTTMPGFMMRNFIRDTLAQLGRDGAGFHSVRRLRARLHALATRGSAPGLDHGRRRRIRRLLPQRSGGRAPADRCAAEGRRSPDHHRHAEEGLRAVAPDRPGLGEREPPGGLRGREGERRLGRRGGLPGAQPARLLDARRRPGGALPDRNRAVPECPPAGPAPALPRRARKPEGLHAARQRDHGRQPGAGRGQLGRRAIR